MTDARSLEGRILFHEFALAMLLFLGSYQVFLLSGDTTAVILMVAFGALAFATLWRMVTALYGAPGDWVNQLRRADPEVKDDG